MPLRTTCELALDDAVRFDDADASVRLPSMRLHVRYDDADEGPPPSLKHALAYADEVRLPWSTRLLHVYDASADAQAPSSSCAWLAFAAPSQSSFACSLRPWSSVESCDESMTSCGDDDELLVRFQPWFPL